MFIWDKLGSGTYHVFRVDRIWIKTASRFQQILICTLRDFGKALFLDGSLQCAEADQALYHRALILPSLRVIREPKHILIIGGGDGSAAYTVLAQKEVKVTMVELDEKVVELSREYLPEFHHGVFENRDLELIFMDGKDFMEKTNELFDIVVVDVTDPGVSKPSQTIYNKAFFKCVKDHLAQNGIMVTQAGSAWFTKQHFSEVGKLITQVFSTVVPYGEFIHSFGSLWGFYIGTDSRQHDVYRALKDLGHPLL